MKYDFSKRPYMNEIQKVSFLQRIVIINSILYYGLDYTAMSDRDFDELCKQLLEETAKLTKEEYQKTNYGYAFDDFDGTTGFDLYDNLISIDQERLKHYALNIKEGKGVKRYG